MDQRILYQLQDGEALHSALTKYKAELAGRGFTDARFTAYETALDDVRKKDAAQSQSQEVLRQRTADQETAIERGYAIIAIVQNAAKSLFGRDKVLLKEFRIGMERPKGVKNLQPVLEYFTGVVQKHSAGLLENGMAQTDIQELTDAYAALITADALQENAKKLRNAATATRDDVADVLSEQVFKVRKFAKACFSTEKAKLEEFKPIPKGRGGSLVKGKETPPPAKPEPPK